MNFKTVLPAAALLSWGVLVFVNYWPPFGFPPGWILRAVSPQGLPVDPVDALHALLQHGWHVLIAGLVLLAARGAGEPARRLLRLRPDSLLVSLPLGLVVLAATGLGLGLAGLLYPSLLWIVIVVTLAAGGRPRGWRVFPEGTGWPVRLLAFSVACLTLFGALAPEVTYDALAYHTGAPGLYLRFHRIVRLSHMFFTDFPLGLQMLYLFAAPLGGGAGAAKVMHWMLGLGCMGVAARLGVLLGGRLSGAWAAAFLVATPFLATQMMKANVDLGVMLMTGVGAYWLIRVRGMPGYTMAGLCFGASAAMKLTGAYGIVAGALVLLVCGQARRGSAARIMTAFAVGAALPLVPWLLKSWLACGNPVYPFLWSVLGGVGWGQENVSVYQQDMTGPTSFNLQYPYLLDRLAGPWLMIMHDRGGEAAFGPFVLWLLPTMLLWRQVGTPGVTRLSLFVGVYWLCWFVSARDPRFFLPVWPVGCALAATALCTITGALAFVARWVCVLAAAFAPCFAASLAYRMLNPGPVVWGAIPRGLYVDRLIPPPGRYAPLAHATNRLVGAHERVLIVGDVKGVTLRPVPWYPSMFDTPHLVAWAREAASADRLRVKFRQRGIHAIFYNVGGAIYLKNQFGHYRYSDVQRQVLQEFWERYLEPLHEIQEGADTVMGLYLVRRQPGPPRPLQLPGETS